MQTKSYGAEAFRAEQAARRSGEPQFNTAAWLRSVAERTPQDGQNREFLEEFRRRSGRPAADPLSVPLELLLNPRLTTGELVAQRDLAVGGTGGYLVGEPAEDVTESLRPFSVVTQAGCRIAVFTGQGDLRLPSETDGPTSYWVTEGSGITQSDATLDGHVLTPHTAGVLMRASRQLLKQTTGSDYLARGLRKSIGELIDAAVIAGTGASGQPTGLSGTSGIQAITGTSIDAGKILDGIKLMRDAGMQGEATFIAGAGAERTLRGRSAETGGGRFLWDGGQILGCPAFATMNSPSASLAAGQWSNCTVALWGDVLAEFNPYGASASDFRAGLVQARILVGVDVHFATPGGFAYVATIS